MDKLLLVIFVLGVGIYVIDTIFHLGIFDKLEKLLEK
jgi:hypothetical protein